MKTIRIIALLALALFALRGEAALGLSPYAPVAANYIVSFDITVNGLGDIPANFYMMTYTGERWDYEWALEILQTPYEESYAHAIVGGKAVFSDTFSEDQFDALNNLCYEIFIDGDHYMLGRFGESPDYSLTLNHIEYDKNDPTEPYMHYYDVSATVEFKDGYVAPFHTGPDPVSVPEPTSGLLLLVGLAAISLRRRA